MVENLNLANNAGFKDLSEREKRLAHALLAGLSQSDACREAGYAESTIKARVGKLVSNSRIQSAIGQAMADAGLTPQMLAAKIRQGIEADDPDKAGILAVNHRYLETAVRLGGHEPTKEVELQESYEDRILRIKGELDDE